MYIQYDGLKYDYEYMVHQIIQNIEVTDKKTLTKKKMQLTILLIQQQILPTIHLIHLQQLQAHLLHLQQQEKKMR